MTSSRNSMRFPSFRARTLRPRKKGQKKTGNEAAIPIRDCFGRLAGDGSPVCLRVWAKIQHRCSARGYATASLPAASSAAQASERPASQGQSEQFASQGYREASGNASAPPGTVPAEQPAVSQSAAGRTGQDSPAPRSVETLDSRAATGLARPAKRLGADDSRATEECSAVAASSLAAI